MSKLLDLWTRSYGDSEIRRRQIAESDLKRYRAEGWALATEPLPLPPPPDLEVLEMKFKDAKKAVEAAKHTLSIEEAKSDSAARFFYAAQSALTKEPGILDTLQRESERKSIEVAARKFVEQMGNKPVDLNRLLQLATSDTQAATIRQIYATEGHVVGRSPSGELMVVANKTIYLREKAEREAAEAAEKEKAIRARMAATTGGH